LRLEQRALDAWADARLIVVRLDDGAAPVGLRDLPAISADGAARADWKQAADAVEAKLGQRARQAAAPARKARGVLGALAMLALALPGLAAMAAIASIWLANRIGPAPGGWAELQGGVDRFGVRYGLQSGVAEWLFAAAIGLMLIVLSAALARAASRPGARRAAPSSATAPAPSGAMFVSYARANALSVLPVIEAAKHAGREFWLDQKGGAVGETWAGDLARAIRDAAGVVVMCSKAAFDSDHVKREVYLADRFRKKLVPVFIERAQPPEDFEYFFAGVESLNLFDTPEAERPLALARALGAAS
jgi:hypothetical protein